MVEIQKRLESAEAENINLKNTINNQIDRSMRSNLVIRGLKKDDSDGKETWEKTEVIIGNFLNRHLNIEIEDGRRMIQRAHRGMGKDRNTVYVNFHSWKDSQFNLENFTKERIKNPNMKIKIDQMYCKDTMQRRNSALIKRKELIQSNNNIIKAHITYPAKLVVKYKNKEKYELFKEF